MTGAVLYLSGFLLGALVRPYVERWYERRLIAQLDAVVAMEIAPQLWVLAFYNDQSGLWAVGVDKPSAQAAALDVWHKNTPADICEEFGDEAWLVGLVLVEVIAEEQVLREVVLPAIEGARHCPAPWGYPAVERSS